MVIWLESLFPLEGMFLPVSDMQPFYSPKVVWVEGRWVTLWRWEVIAGCCIPLQTKHLMWKCLFWTRRASPLHGFPQFWQGIGPPPPPPPPCFCFCFFCSRGLWTACCWNTGDRHNWILDLISGIDGRYTQTHTSDDEQLNWHLDLLDFVVNRTVWSTCKVWSFNSLSLFLSSSPSQALPTYIMQTSSGTVQANDAASNWMKSAVSA